MPEPDELTQLQKLIIQEVSGVDSPASMLDGWMVMKSRDRADVLAIVEEGVRKYLADKARVNELVRKTAEKYPAEMAEVAAQCVTTLREVGGVEPLIFEGVRKTRVLYRHPKTGKFVSREEAMRYHDAAPTATLPGGAPKPFPFKHNDTRYARIF